MRFDGFIAALAALVMVWPGQALAQAEALPLSQFDLIGYSSDGRYFAFETYGYEGPEALGFSHIMVMDLARRDWVIGSPVIADAFDATDSLDDMRQQAHDKARSLLADLDVVRPAYLAALNGDGMPDAGGRGDHLQFGVPDRQGTVGPGFDLRLTAFPVRAAAPCDAYSEQPPMGFSLAIESPGGSTTIHKDEALPRSRGCPFAYRVKAVALPFQARDMRFATALVAVMLNGPDGAVRDFVAVPLGAQTTDKN